MRTRKLFQKKEIFKKKSSQPLKNLLKYRHGRTHLRFLTILISQYLSDVDQELLVALLRVGTYDLKIKLPFSTEL